MRTVVDQSRIARLAGVGSQHCANERLRCLSLQLQPMDVLPGLVQSVYDLWWDEHGLCKISGSPAEVALPCLAMLRQINHSPLKPAPVSRGAPLHSIRAFTPVS